MGVGPEWSGEGNKEMSTLVGLRELSVFRQPPLMKGRAQDRRSSAAGMKAVEWASILWLLAAAALLSHVTPHEGVSGFIVAAGAMIMMFQEFVSRPCVQVLSFSPSLRTGGTE
jgi:hypothetical protein